MECGSQDGSTVRRENLNELEPISSYDYNQLQNLDVYGAKGNKIGSVDQVLTDTNTGKHYLLVKAGPSDSAPRTTTSPSPPLTWSGMTGL